ncbi:hypothetical protein B0H14DRAFT_3507022 [Mycena olivaceomarginata]|nr:hypothetical protein B0H14DRAFT_3507022 [Mycena olivaceomarginata]
MAPHGKPAYFFGEPLKILTDFLPLYLSTAANKKEDFWTQFNPVWVEAYKELDEDEKEELEDLEESYKDEKKATQEENQEQKKKKGRRKAVLKPLPQTSERLNELRAHGADLMKIKQWYWNQRTKDKGRPRRLRMAWVLWRDPKHGDVLRRRYRTKYGKDADEETEEDGGAVDPFEKEKGEEGDDEDDEDENDPSQGDLLQRKLRPAVAYLDELMDEEKSRLTECREKDFEGRSFLE